MPSHTSFPAIPLVAGANHRRASAPTPTLREVTFKVTNAPAGTYTTDIAQVVLTDSTTFSNPNETDSNDDQRELPSAVVVRT